MTSLLSQFLSDDIFQKTHPKGKCFVRQHVAMLTSNDIALFRSPAFGIIPANAGLFYLTYL